ncbi:MAG: ATP-binding protein, partial [bacterium]|nr:ATP-binding protein [bacterium]
SQWVEDLVPAVRRASESSRNYVDGLGGTLSVEMHADSLPVLHSPIDIEQALINLIRNAAESRTHGAAVRVETRRRGEWAEVLITDDGGGIPEGDRSRVFDPFYTTRLDAGGSGLGLSVVHGVVQNHRGTLSIESPEAGGTRFRVSLPLVVERPTSERE